jgi:taurine dioxygenase
MLNAKNRDVGFVVNLLGPGAAEIIGLDCSRALSDDDFDAVKRTFNNYPVLVFRHQKLTAPQLAAFSRRFGNLESYGIPPAVAADEKDGTPHTAALPQNNGRQTPDQMLYLSPDDPDILVMTNEVRAGQTPVGIVDNAELWHSDASHKAEPCAAIVVNVVRNPAAGGDTEFCDLRAVHDALTPEIRNTLEHLAGVHHWSKSKNPRFADTLAPEARIKGERIAALIPEIKQPVVRTHPDTGRPALYLSPRFTIRLEGVPPPMSDVLLKGIFDLMEDKRFIYRHRWREGDLMIWDNRCLNHRVRSYAADDIRTRYRATVAGTRPYFRIPVA